MILVFFHAGCPSCHQTDSVKALKELQALTPNQWLSIHHRTPDARGVASFMLDLQCREKTHKHTLL